MGTDLQAGYHDGDPVATKPDRLHRLIDALRDHAIFDHPTGEFELIETHISCILLTGKFAYKFKKPVNLGFLDFSSLARRKFYCEEELRLNRRFAADIYLDVIAITGNPIQPLINGQGEAIEYAVKMVQFPRDSELEQILNKGLLKASHIDDLARQIAEFHQRATHAPQAGPYGNPGAVRGPALDNFVTISASPAGAAYTAQLQALKQWTLQMFDESSALFNSRKENGFIRECHGDLHLGNIVLLGDRPLPFDCIEFSEEFRWIDVINEAAFLFMDLDAHGKPELGRRFLNRYLEITGDYESLQLLAFYYVYRAMIRCKVACIRLKQQALTALEKDREREHIRHYLELASRHMDVKTGAILITHGLSGSGKSTITQLLLERMDAIRIRSDVERKRLHGLDADRKTGSGPGAGIYTHTDTELTYNQLLSSAKLILKAGYPVIVDATFLQARMRDMFYQLAQDLALPFVILDFQAREADLQKRVLERQAEARDASEAGLEVLEYQIKHTEPLSETEKRHALVIDTSNVRDIEDIVRTILSRMGQQ